MIIRINGLAKQWLRPTKEIVRFPIEPHNRDEICARCGGPLKRHGYIDDPPGIAVCPGDYVVKFENGRMPMPFWMANMACDHRDGPMCCFSLKLWGKLRDAGGDKPIQFISISDAMEHVRMIEVVANVELEHIVNDDRIWYYSGRSFLRPGALVAEIKAKIVPQVPSGGSKMAPKADKPASAKAGKRKTKNMK